LKTTRKPNFLPLNSFTHSNKWVIHCSEMLNTQLSHFCSAWPLKTTRKPQICIWRLRRNSTTKLATLLTVFYAWKTHPPTIPHHPARSLLHRVPHLTNPRKTIQDTSFWDTGNYKQVYPYEDTFIPPFGIKESNPPSRTHLQTSFPQNTSRKLYEKR